MGIRKDDNQPTLRELILSEFERSRRTEEPLTDREKNTCSRLAEQYSENDLRAALAMRAAYERAERNKRSVTGISK